MLGILDAAPGREDPGAPLGFPAAVLDFPAREGDPAERAEARDLRDRLLASVRDLPEPYRSAVELRFLAGREPRDIARERSIPASTVRTQVLRGLEMLRGRLRGAASSA